MAIMTWFQRLTLLIGIVCSPAPFDAAVVYLRMRIAAAVAQYQRLHHLKSLGEQQTEPQSNPDSEGFKELLSVAGLIQELCTSYSATMQSPPRSSPGRAAQARAQSQQGGLSGEHMYSSLVELLLFQVWLPPAPYGLDKQDDQGQWRNGLM